ncbi:DUF1097 domain-containing protein [Photobacterium sp. SDRW27]|uniref:DUF1097 domain-containing protein n=1 Tax=Photobacterium obscurum TaxID=2829490 RepID=UPI002244A827|nr:DUF1097 domain-containing protein [Photobacterium obscurum]MCW8329327.1 DUF1097 domain-containing protein [Photobacterium obscurum]
MSVLVAIAITTGILSGIWGWVAVSLGLLSWAGFLGCTTYFASPKDGVKGLGLSIVTNLSGVFWALVIIHLSTVIGIEIIGYVVTAVVAFLMCVQAKKSWLNFIPGTFIGSCATFAANGDWQLVVPSLILGAIFGYTMKASGLWLQQKLNQPKGDYAAAELD